MAGGSSQENRGAQPDWRAPVCETSQFGLLAFAATFLAAAFFIFAHIIAR
jgi:hypothetical protein